MRGSATDETVSGSSEKRRREDADSLVAPLARQKATSRFYHDLVVVVALLLLVHLMLLVLLRSFAACKSSHLRRRRRALDAVLGLDAAADEGEDGLRRLLREVLCVEELRARADRVSVRVRSREVERREGGE